jgi:hypothetical protein
VRVPTTIIIKSNVSLNRTEGPEMVLPSSVRNVEDLLVHIGKEIGFVFLDAQTGKLRPDIDILVNGKEIWFYPQALKKPVFDGDSIDITLIPLGGG